MEIAKAGLDQQKIANARLKFSLLAALAWVFIHFGGFYRPRAKCAPITRYLRAQRAAIGQYKRREILSHTSAFRFKI